MDKTYAVAAAVAMAAGVNAAHHGSLPYWRRWDSGSLLAALVPIHLLYALTGVAVTALATVQNWKFGNGQPEYDWLNGALYGGAALALLRIEITSFGLAAVSPARTLFRLGLEVLEPLLDAATERAIARRLGELPPTSLSRVTWRLYYKHFEQRLLPEDALFVARRLLALHEQACAPRGAPGHEEAVRVSAQEHLRVFCELVIVAEHDATIDLKEPPDAHE